MEIKNYKINFSWPENLLNNWEQSLSSSLYLLQCSAHGKNTLFPGYWTYIIGLKYSKKVFQALPSTQLMALDRESVLFG